jgi:EpsI family protein
LTTRSDNCRVLAVNAALLLALLGGNWGRRTAAPADVPPDLLSRMPLPFRGWATADQGLTAREKALLRPDAVLLRRYRSPGGQTAELAVIAGHRKQTVHTPAFCMAGDGWEIVAKRAVAVTLEDRRIAATRAVLVSDGRELLATYFFTDGRLCTPSLLRFQGVQLLERLHAQPPFGALVRILVPVRGNRNAAERLSNDFARSVLPEILKSLRGARARSPERVHLSVDGVSPNVEGIYVRHVKRETI